MEQTDKLNKIIRTMINIQDALYDLMEVSDFTDVTVNRYIAYALKESQLFTMTDNKLYGNKYYLGKFKYVNVIVDKFLHQHDTNIYLENGTKHEVVNKYDLIEMINYLKTIGK